MRMTEKYVLIEHECTINAIIHKTFQGTHRIKLTAFDVSNKYITLGASSGGIYIFNREPCSFIKLIPSQHGPVSLIAISDNEENIAVATASGLVVIVESCFDSLIFQQQVYSEHEHQTLTALKWNGCDLYCGDTAGKVSVITTKDFLTKAIFQTPTACLMHLDSPIVQIDAHSKFLLISTTTRSLICDTEAERYKQIGKKLRDGPFGSCFFGADEKALPNGTSETRGKFQTVQDNEQFTSSSCDADLKIYCARPGARLWLADIQATVMYTHQFKGALNQRQSDVIHLSDSQLKISSYDAVVNTKDFSFGRIYKCLDRFILSFNQDGLFIFEPACSSLAFWSKDQNIRDIRVLNNLLYIWSKDLEVNVLSLNTIEDLILKTLMRKQYTVCGQLCVKFSKEIEEMIPTSRKIHLITILASKLNGEEHSDLLKELSSLIERIKGEAKQKLPLGKVKNGITIVNNMHSLNGTDPAETSNVGDEKKNKSPLDILREQYKVHKTHRNVNTKDFSELLESIPLNEVYDLLHEFSSDELSSIWCKEIFLGLLHKTGNYYVLSEENKLNFATEAFLIVNSTCDSTCKMCDFPLPAAHLVKPQYYTTGCKLMDKLGEHESLTKNIPYMHKFSLEKLSEHVEIKEKLSLVIQYSDEEIIRNLSKSFTYDLWDDSLRLLAALRHGYCLNCGREIDSKASISWQSFSKIIVQSINAVNTMKLLERYADLIPAGDLDESFYQHCIFSSVSNLTTKQLNAVDEMINADVNLEKHFDRSVARFLNKKYLNSELYTLVPKKPPTIVLTCDYCNLPLSTPILDELNRLQCGHIYHKICFLHKENTCCVCNNK